MFFFGGDKFGPLLLGDLMSLVLNPFYPLLNGFLWGMICQFWIKQTLEAYRCRSHPATSRLQVAKRMVLVEFCLTLEHLVCTHMVNLRLGICWFGCWLQNRPGGLASSKNRWHEIS